VAPATPPPQGPAGPGAEGQTVTVRFLGPARQATGCATSLLPGTTVGEVLAAATDRFGAPLDRLLATCQVWCNGEPAPPRQRVAPGDEVAVLPPVSGGATVRPFGPPRSLP
jgi:molybdopterin synthase sulfur carrier subunit